MSIDVVVKHSKQIEANLRKLGADGKGLHELITSLDEQFEGALIKKIRFVASVRNAAIHEEGYELSEATLASYVAACDEINAALKAAMQERAADPSGRKRAEPQTDSDREDLMGAGNGQATSLGEMLKALLGKEVTAGQRAVTVGEVFKKDPWIALSLLNPVAGSLLSGVMGKKDAVNADSQFENQQEAWPFPKP
jgi:hypothetical protein